MESIANRRNLRESIEEIKNLKLDDWDGDYKLKAKEALKEALEETMGDWISRYLGELESRDIYDRRNGYFSRHFLTGLGDIELEIPRSRTASAVSILGKYKRRPEEINRAILEAFVLGLSTRKVGVVLENIIGEKVSPSLVSQIAKRLDEVVEAYHRRKLKDEYRFLFFDGVVIKRKTGAGVEKRVILVALGIRWDGRGEIIDFVQVLSESASACERFLRGLVKRGIIGERTEMIVIDGGKGLIRAVLEAYPDIPIQRCWAHKTRNVLNNVRKGDQEVVKKDVHKISHAGSEAEARRAAGAFKSRWEGMYPKAVQCLFKDLDDLLNFFRIKDCSLWSQVRTTNAIERRFVEVRRRTRPMGVFQDRTSVERILFAVLSYENKKAGTMRPFEVPLG